MRRHCKQKFIDKIKIKSYLRRPIFVFKKVNYLIIEFLLTIFMSVGFRDTAYAEAAVTLFKKKANCNWFILIVTNI